MDKSPSMWSYVAIYKANFHTLVIDAAPRKNGTHNDNTVQHLEWELTVMSSFSKCTKEVFPFIEAYDLIYFIFFHLISLYLNIRFNIDDICHFGRSYQTSVSIRFRKIPTRCCCRPWTWTHRRRRPWRSTTTTSRWSRASMGKNMAGCRKRRKLMILQDTQHVGTWMRNLCWIYIEDIRFWDEVG